MRLPTLLAFFTIAFPVGIASATTQNSSMDGNSNDAANCSSGLMNTAGSVEFRLPIYSMKGHSIEEIKAHANRQLPQQGEYHWAFVLADNQNENDVRAAAQALAATQPSHGGTEFIFVGPNLTEHTESAQPRALIRIGESSAVKVLSSGRNALLSFSWAAPPLSLLGWDLAYDDRDQAQRFLESTRILNQGQTPQRTSPVDVLFTFGGEQLSDEQAAANQSMICSLVRPTVTVETPRTQASPLYFGEIICRDNGSAAYGVEMRLNR